MNLDSTLAVTKTCPKDGVHLLDLFVPLRGSLGLGVAGEYFFRRTFFKDEAQTRKSFRHPQLRVFLTWRLS